MRIFIFLAISFLALKAKALTPEEALEKAQTDLEANLEESMVAGAQSRRGKKVTSNSAAMSVRNAIFRRVVEILKRNGATSKEAVRMTKQVMSMFFGRHRPG